MIVVVDYGMGNLRSVEKAFSFLGHRVTVSREPAAVAEATGIVLPGVGSFGDAVNELQVRGLLPALKEAIRAEKPFLGICLGYQLLCGSSEESPGVNGLGVLPGRVLRFPPRVKVPHMGWNDISMAANHPVLAGVEEGSFFYFVHSFYVVREREEDVLTTTDYGLPFASGAAFGSVVAFQFHPEKSSQPGLRILDNFAHWCAKEG